MCSPIGCIINYRCQKYSKLFLSYKGIRKKIQSKSRSDQVDHDFVAKETYVKSSDFLKSSINNTESIQLQLCRRIRVFQLYLFYCVKKWAQFCVVNKNKRTCGESKSYECGNVHFLFQYRSKNQGPECFKGKCPITLCDSKTLYIDLNKTMYKRINSQ